MIDLNREEHWHREYAQLHADGPEWLDYAAAEEQTFTFGACLIASGAVRGARCLDAGCGKGSFARVLRALGAREVVGLDFVEPTIRALRHSDPDIRWDAGSVTDSHVVHGLGTFDAVYAIELLQYVAPEALFEKLWAAVAPAGRLVGVVPNGDNSFVRKRADERPGLYAPLGADALLRHLSALPAVADWGLVGLLWRSDRSSVLYDMLPLAKTSHWPAPPKRLLFLARKRR